MSEGPQASDIDVYQSRRFEKALDKLPESLLRVVEDEIDKIIQNPLLGERKKGDLGYLRVYKFQLNNPLTLLGYSWVEAKLNYTCLPWVLMKISTSNRSNARPILKPSVNQL